MSHQYYLSLNKPKLLFFSPSDAITGRSEGDVVMVTIKGALQNVVKEISMFYLFQYDITKAVESIIFAHILTPLPPEVKVRGKGYELTGTRKEWKYGKKLRLGWGECSVQVGREKWIFVFEVESETENDNLVGLNKTKDIECDDAKEH